MATLLEAVTSIILTEVSKNNRLNETFIAKKLGVSRTPIREVLHYLEEDGFIKRQQGLGISLSGWSLQDVIETHDIRAVLESAVCRILAPRINKIILKKLQKIDRGMNRLANSPNHRLDKIADQDVQFHQTIIKNCGNERLARLINRLQLIPMSFFMPKYVSGSKMASEKYESRKHTHQRIIAALASGDQKKAGRAMYLHIEEVKKSVIRDFAKYSKEPKYSG